MLDSELIKLLKASEDLSKQVYVYIEGECFYPIIDVGVDKQTGATVIICKNVKGETSK